MPSNFVEVLIEIKNIPLLEKNSEGRKAYCKPQLEELGDLRTLTLGATQGCGDSSNFYFIEHNPNGGGPC